MKIKIKINKKIFNELKRYGFKIKGNKAILEGEKDAKGKSIERFEIEYGKESYFLFPDDKKIKAARILLAIKELEEKKEYYQLIDEILRTIEDKKEKRIEKNNCEEKAIELRKIKKENEELKNKIKMLEQLPDEAIEEYIIEWIEKRKGDFSITKFSKEHKITEQRTLLILNNMIKKGLIKRID